MMSPMSLSSQPLIGVVMGSRSDFETMEHALNVLQELKVPYEVRVLSAHRTPHLLSSYAESARGRGLRAIIAGAGGAAHLPGMLASFTTLPVLGVPVQSKTMSGLDSLYSIVQMPGGIPVGTFAIGKAGATNAGIFAASLLSSEFPEIRETLDSYRSNLTQTVLDNPYFEGHPEAPTGENTP
ncbi:N5-carboxyaminoimidazole ribonucleotide mutase [Deinococcus roseus]|uniref:N5-carboxyaminoimidazole ribonucleotide mutase n=2 Tax=Deinococcus roseus TaxID=392414 RepID=A0ABQ2D9L5_9DEIO|nr:N5-carboxyaminoimidazole ribonucleotide mutase [Deinococcus roseus]